MKTYRSWKTCRAKETLIGVPQPDGSEATIEKGTTGLVPLPLVPDLQRDNIIEVVNHD